ncbi:YheC/YheD family protein [Paenibacillus sp. MMS20-IR301]|uniref:YheC/YheD family endospore coat-associated protein n=1 Tax=Paenibacillus sp. MMS20-IR301 TaxID=2895946 RepID=UPI0028EF8DA1|nr:YheC/YheD family protein [Paenibacillus sp. MMS20-IR301]WNS46386.1 YheC/YheD family protein [Paenibacillus sp. MMS20-IR301]
MSQLKIPVHTVHSGILQENAVMLGDKSMKRLKIPAHGTLLLTFGSLRQEVTVIPVPKSDSLRLSEGLARRLGLRQRLTLNASYSTGSRTLRLGPLIGVLVSRDHPEQPDRVFGQITMFCRELTNACHAQGAYVYFFTPEALESRGTSIQGWVYDEGWRKLSLPVADVINNRLTTRKVENKPSVQHFLADVKSRYGTHFFNEKFLDKTEVFEALAHDPALQRYLPESHALNGFAVLKKMCGTYSSVFLKPVRGSLGKGILRISKEEGGGYRLLSTTPMGSRKQSYPSLAKLFGSIAPKMKTTRYQIQQGLPLMELGRRPVDFRALVQKNGTGKWGVTSIVARTAGSNHFVSNLARGGTLSTVREAISKSSLPSGVKESVQVQLPRAALAIARGVETYIPAHFGELGIDLALDQSGRIWLLEVNSKPSKNDNTPLNDQKIRPSVKQMILYCRYLAGL